MPDNGKNHVNIDVVESIINTYGNLKDGFDLEKTLKIIDPANRAHSFEASPEEEAEAARQSKLEEQSKSEETTPEGAKDQGAKPTISMSKNNTVMLMARNDFGTGSKDSSITYPYDDIPNQPLCGV